MGVVCIAQLKYIVRLKLSGFQNSKDSASQGAGYQCYKWLLARINRRSCLQKEVPLYSKNEKLKVRDKGMVHKIGTLLCSAPQRS